MTAPHSSSTPASSTSTSPQPYVQLLSSRGSPTARSHLFLRLQLQLPIPSSSIFRTPAKGHRGSVTAAVASHDGQWLYTSSKDGAILKYSLGAVSSSSPSSSATPTDADADAVDQPRITRAAYMKKALSESQKRNAEKHKRFDAGAAAATEKGKGKEVAEGHTDEVLDLAISHDGRILASAGRDKVIGCWNVEGDGGKWLRGLGGHKDVVGVRPFFSDLSLEPRRRERALTSPSPAVDRLPPRHQRAVLVVVRPHRQAVRPVDPVVHRDAVRPPGLDPVDRRPARRGGRHGRRARQDDPVLEDGRGVAARVPRRRGEPHAQRARRRDGGRGRRGRGAQAAPAARGGQGPGQVCRGERRLRRHGRRLDDAERRRQRVRPALSLSLSSFLSRTRLTRSRSSLARSSICLWNITKKKPIFTKQLAHGINEHASESEGVIGTARWITALATLPYGDVFASGSWDGSIRLWRIDERVRSFSQIATIDAPGFVNSLQLTAPALRPTKETHVTPVNTVVKGSKKGGEAAGEQKQEKALIVVAATSKEPRLGRWMRFKDAKDGALVAVIPMQ